MKILFTASDRDLLSVYSRLLLSKGYAVDTAFDGVIAKTMASCGEYDLVVLDESLSRITSADVLKTLNEKAVPVVLLTSKRLVCETYCRPSLPDAFLCYPFSPDELDERIKAVVSLDEADDFRVCGITVSPKNRCISGGLRITADEAELLKLLSLGGGLRDTRVGELVRAINEKLSMADADGRIGYVKNIGYKAVKRLE